MTTVPDPVTLPCGCFVNCVVNNGVNEMRISPCQPGCRNLANALALAAETGTPVERRVGS
jgi:hypothetical protein